MKHVVPALLAASLLFALPANAGYPFANEKWKPQNKPGIDARRAITLAQRKVGTQYYLLTAGIAVDGSIKNNKPAGTWICTFGNASGKQKQVWVNSKGWCQVSDYPTDY